eukprot:gnl/MRDRNA2_/MRDRNA2_66436_c0_seq2.p1 gnl/MRDRNA2_/MRDRNA2_66436_c0~~gnl/MRDRNA2_/MRDRNA2_66436_c0_seq2.p1  ORF type:complete len:458 (-),score=84.41 gnl/MRDRNA2_/MRDRNA2_66436_c0_seq2:44-1417(-)
MHPLHGIIFFCFSIYEVWSVSGSELFQAVDHGVAVAIGASNKLSEQGHLGNLQPMGIVEALVYVVRNARLIFGLAPMKQEQRATSLKELQNLEDGLINAPGEWYQKTLAVIQGFLTPELRSSVEAKELPMIIDRPGPRSISVSGHSIGEALIDLGGGQLMPLLGFGTGIFYKGPEDVAEAIRYAATELGYRHFDCAQAYHNEEIVGRGLKASGVPRKELFISTKLSDPSFLGRSQTPGLVHEQMKKLGVDYLDLYMFHSELHQGDEEKEKEAWQALEKLHAAGTIRALGLSNYGIDGIKRIISFAKVKPVYLQIKYDVYHPGYQFARAGQDDVVAWAQNQGLVVVGYSTLSGWPFVLRSVQDPYIEALASKYKKSAGQLLLRHSLQRGLALIPSSADRDRLKDNTEIFDFEIDAEDMVLMDGLAHFTSFAKDNAPTWIPDVYGARVKLNVEAGVDEL